MQMEATEQQSDCEAVVTAVDLEHATILIAGALSSYGNIAQ